MSMTGLCLAPSRAQARRPIETECAGVRHGYEEGAGCTGLAHEEAPQGQLASATRPPCASAMSPTGRSATARSNEAIFAGYLCPIDEPLESLMTVLEVWSSAG
jgi:hypothetical protein